MNKKIWVGSLLLLLLVPTFTWAQSQAEHTILLKEVLTDESCKQTKDYDCGSDIYPDYALAGLPPTFGIKKDPSIVIPASAILKVKVSAEIFEKWGAWHIEIDFSDDIGKQMEAFTANKSGKNLAFVIDGKVLLVATVYEKIGSELQVTSTKDRIEAMEDLLKIIHPEITRQIVKVPSNTPVHPDAAEPPRR